MKLKDLIKRHNFVPVWKKLVDYYPDQRDAQAGYLVVWHKLQELEPKESKFTIHVETVYAQFEGDEDYVTVHAKKPGDDSYWAIEFTEWAEWLGMEVVSEFNNMETIAHCLWEMTFAGWTQEEVKEHWMWLTNGIRMLL
jgi:hypothetical protein